MPTMRAVPYDGHSPHAVRTAACMVPSLAATVLTALSPTVVAATCHVALQLPAVPASR